MADIDKLYRDYIAEHRAGGEADPRAYLDQLEGADRTELEALIAGYLRRAPGRSWDPDAYAGSPAERAAQAIAAEWGEWELASEPRPWTELLPALRERAKIKRGELVERLAAAIGYPSETERVAAYYHQMETGKLPSEGVSDTVLEALGKLVGESAAKLRAAGSAIGAGADPQDVSTQVAFARVAIRNPAYEAEGADTAPTEEPEPPPAAASAEPPARTVEDLQRLVEAEHDEVDRLFTGGPDAAG